MKLWCCLGWKLSDQCCEHSRPAEGELFITTEEGLSLECEVESLCDDAKEQEENDNHNDDGHDTKKSLRRSESEAKTLQNLNLEKLCFPPIGNLKFFWMS